MTIKLVVTGGTGLVATELIRQGLQLPQITTLVVLSRKPVAVPAGTEASKLKQVLIGDYGEYPDHARRELAGADACIWCVYMAVFPFAGLACSCRWPVPACDSVEFRR